MNKYGFINIPQQPEDYLFGAGNIVSPVLQPDGQWVSYLPPEELQAARGFETYACASFGTLNAVEVLCNRLFGLTDNFSDRFLAKISGTEFSQGNSPHTVAEFLRKNGAPYESTWSYDETVDTYDKFYKEIPTAVRQVALGFIDYYTFKHEYVPNDPTSMKEALKYSPLAMSVSAWTQDDKGLYFNPGMPNNHWTMVYGYNDVGWLVFDSYDATHKVVRFDAIPEVVKRYYIALAPKTQNWFTMVIEALRSFLKSNQTAMEPTPVIPVSEEPTPSPTPQTPSVPPSPYKWDTKENARHSVRVICDEMGLTLKEKEIITACIRQESNFDNKAVGRNKDKKTGQLLSTDWGIVQINDYWNIGPGKKWSSIQQVLDNPEKCVRWMITMMKQGKLYLWASYSSGAYKQWLPK